MRRFLPLLALSLAGPAAALSPLALERALGAPAQEVPAAADRAGLEALRRQARSQVQARRLEEAIRSYERILAIAPGDVDALSHVAQLLAWTGSYDRAVVLYREALAHRPSDPGLKSDLADVLVWARRLEEAERLYREVLAVRPQHHEALKGLARSLLLGGDARGAREVLERALALYPGDVDLHRDRARMLFQLGDGGRAIESLLEAVRLAPADADVVRHLAEAYQQAGRWEQAVETWLRVAQLDPDSPASQVALARAYLALGRPALAREHAGLALRMSPTDAAANQVAAELDREAGIAPIRSAAEWLEVAAYLLLLPVVLLVVRKTRRQLKRRPAAWRFAAYVVPAFVVLNVVAHLAKGALWRHVDEQLVEAVTQAVLFLGLAVAFVAVLRTGPEIRELAGQVVLAIGAHPDDIELGCAGFLLKLKASGAQVHGLTLTRGEKGNGRNGDREAESRRAAAFLGLDGYTLLGFPDTGLGEQVPAVKAAIEAKVFELGASMVLTHAPEDVHGDHRAVFAATREAARAVPTVLCYEDVSTANHFTPSVYVDISGNIEEHLRACALHRTQADRPYMDPRVIEGRAAHRGLQAGVHFALAFQALRLIR